MDRNDIQRGPLALDLKYEKSELFDPHILAPHSELNNGIYETVDKLIDKMGASSLSLCFHTEKLGEIVQEKVRESYFEHYSDELRGLSRSLTRIYIRAVLLLVISLTLLFFSLTFSWLQDRGLILLVVTNIGVYFLWELGNTWFRWLDLTRRQSNMRTARSAKITFAEYRRRIK